MKSPYQYLPLRWIISSISIPWGSLSGFGSQYFFTNNHNFSCIFTNKEFIFHWNLTYRGFYIIQYFIPNLLTSSYFRSLSSMFALWKLGGHSVEGKEISKYPQANQKSPRFSLTEREVMSLCFYPVGVRIMVFNATFNNISIILWLSVLLVEETRIPGENNQPFIKYNEPWNPSPHIKREK